MTILQLLGSLFLVFIASLLLVNVLEWLGHRLHLGSSFVGAILSPLFTSLPELIVILIAILARGGRAGEEIGIGTIFGEPFMVSSLSYGLLGIVILVGFLTRKRDQAFLAADKTLSIPYIFITIFFPLTLVPGYVHVIWVRYLFGFLFLGGFIFYIWLMYRRRMSELIEEAEELTFGRWLSESPAFQMTALVVQILVAVSMLYFGSLYLVTSVEAISQGINVSPLGLAVIIIPVATAIPETINALVWGYRGKDTLSIGSLVGEKILYSTFYPALGLFLTAWELDIHALYSVIVTTVISLVLLYYLLRGKLPLPVLIFGIFFFIAYAILTLVVKI